MIRKIATTAIALLLTLGASAQSHEWTVRLGYNVGGTSPLPLPSEMESINSFNPGGNFGIEGDYEHLFSDKWGLMGGVRLESKGMQADVTVANYHTALTQGNDRTEGNFTGQQSTDVSFALITVPVQARFHINDKWTVGAGPYISYALSREFKGAASNGYMRTLRVDPVTSQMVPTGDRIEITPETPATYDFSSNLRHLQWGVEVGADWKCSSNVLVFAHLDWGMNDVFRHAFKETISFSMFPIYGMIGAGYSF